MKNLASVTRQFVNKCGWIAILAIEIAILGFGFRYWDKERSSALDLTLPPAPTSSEPPPVHFDLQLNLALRPNGLGRDELEVADAEFRRYLGTPAFARVLERFGDNFSLRVWSGYWFQIPKLEVGAAEATAGVLHHTVPQLALNSHGTLNASPGDSEIRSRVRLGTKYSSAPPGFNLPVPTLVPYPELRSLLARELVGTNFGASQRVGESLKIEDVIIYSAGEQCVIGVKVTSIDGSSSRRGWIYFRATPSLESSDQTLRLSALALTSQRPGVEPVPQIIVKALNDAILSAAILDVRSIKGAALGRAREMLDDLVEPAFMDAFEAPIWELEGAIAPIASPAGFDGSLYYLTAHDIHVADQGLLVIWMASGWVTAAFSADEGQARALAEAAAESRRREALRQQREAEMRERERLMRQIRHSLRGRGM